MKTFFAVIVLVNIFLSSEAIFNDIWPRYIGRCSRNSPNFNNCALVKSNMALSTILQGDANFGFPNMSPLTYKRLSLGKGLSWNIEMTDVEVLGIQRMGITAFNWDWASKSVTLNVTYLGSVIFRGDYTSIGRFGTILVNGKGKMEIILVGGVYGTNLTYTMNYNTMNISGLEYLQIRSNVCKRQSGFRIQFTNDLITKEQAQRDADYINAHGDEAVEQIAPDLSAVLCNQINAIFNGLFFTFPLNFIVPEN